MIGCRPQSSLGNLACRVGKEDCASASLFCEESCPTKPPAVFSVASGALRVEGGGAAAVRARAGGAAAGSLRRRPRGDGAPVRPPPGRAPFGAGRPPFCAARAPPHTPPPAPLLPPARAP